MTWAIPPAVLQQLRAAAEAALEDEADAVLEKAQAIAPKEHGDLAASGERLPPEWHGDILTVTVGFGGTPDTAAYAEIQHERADFKHAAPGQAFYLAQPANEALDGLSERIVARMAKKLG